MSYIPDVSSTKIVLNSQNYNAWAVLMDSELDNICCGEIMDADDTLISSEVEKKSYHLILRHLDENHVTWVADTLREDERRRGSILWKLLKSKYAGDSVHQKGIAFNKLFKLKYSSFEQFVAEARSSIAKFK